MRALLAVLLLAMAPDSTVGQPISGAQVVALVRAAMQDAGLDVPQIDAPLRALPACGHTPSVTPRNDDWSQVQLDCTAPIWWRRVLRTNAPPRPKPIPGGPVKESDQAGPMILVTTRPLVRGQRITADDVRPAQGAQRLGSLQPDANIEGRRLRVALQPDQPILERHLEPDFDIAQDQEVTLRLNEGGIDIGIAARALANGWIGDKIAVQPWNSDRHVQAQIIAKGILQVSPNISAPPAVKR